MSNSLNWKKVKDLNLDKIELTEMQKDYIKKDFSIMIFENAVITFLMAVFSAVVITFALIVLGTVNYNIIYVLFCAAAASPIIIGFIDVLVCTLVYIYRRNTLEYIGAAYGIITNSHYENKSNKKIDKCNVSILLDDYNVNIEHVAVNKINICALKKETKALLIVFSKKEFNVYPVDVTEKMLKEVL